MRNVILSTLTLFLAIQMSSVVEMNGQTSNNDGLLPLPEGTEITYNGQETVFDLPEGYSLIGIDHSTNAISTSGGGTVTCNCTSGDGTCQPAETSDHVGCQTEKDDICSTCQMNTSKELQVLDLYFISIDGEPDLPILSGEMAVTNDLSLWHSLDWADSQVIQENNEEIEEVIDYIEQSSAGGTNVLVAIGLSNRKALLQVPFDLVEPGMMYTIDEEGGTTTKKYCTGCSSSCKLVKKAFGKVRTCEGNCDSGCTLHW